MEEILESIKYFIASHKVASIAVASVVGVSAVGAGGYGIYNLVTDEEPQVEEEEFVDDYQAADVYLPEFKNVKITSESLEKDITIYISDENDNPISGVPFEVKLLTPEAAEGLQSYVDAIKDLDTQIAEYTQGYDLPSSEGSEGTEESTEGGSFNADDFEGLGDSSLPVDGEGIDFSKSNKETKSSKSEDSSEEDSDITTADGIDVDSVPNQSDRVLAVLQDRNVDVTVTDENGKVIDIQHGDMSTDPLYLLLLDKETAVQAYTVALNEAEGVVYTDDDQDGVIKETDVQPGDYMLGLVNDIESGVSFEPAEYSTAANVKDKVEYKAQKEIKKQIKKDAPKEDGQKKEAVPVEATLKDTVEFVDSRKEENGHKVLTTTEVVAPKTTAKNSKAVEKSGAAKKLSAEHKVAAKTYTITFKYALLTKDGKTSAGTMNPAKNATMQVAKDQVPAFTPDTSVTKDGKTYNLVDDKKPTLAKATENKEYTYTYQEASKPKHTVKVYYKLGETKVEQTGKAVTDEEGTKHTITADTTVTSGDKKYKLTSAASQDVTIAQKDSEVVFEYAEEAPAKKDVTLTIQCIYTDYYSDGKTVKGTDTVETTKTFKEGESYSVSTSDIDVKSGYESEGATSDSGTISSDKTVTFKFKKNLDEAAPGSKPAGDKGDDDDKGDEVNPGLQLRLFRFSPLGTKGVPGKKYAAQTDPVEKVTMAVSYKEGTFTIALTSAGGAKGAALTVNGTAVTVKDGKATFAATKDGDYTFLATPEWSTGAGSKEDILTTTWTVSGFGTPSTEQLKDKAGNLLFLDEALTKPAKASDYKAGQAYYYKSATYTYYGWQSIDGNTYYYDKNGNRITGTQVIQGVSYDFGPDGVLIVKGTGIDVSKYQGNIDWKQAKSAVNFAIIRCGYRGMYDGQLHEDPYFYKNMSGARAAGVNVGVYVYSTALNEAEAVQEASMAVVMAGHAGGASYPIYIDMEDTVRGQSSLSTEQRMAIVNAFCSTVQASGYKGGVYCSKNWMEKRMNASAIPGNVSVWIAQYNTQCTYSGRKNMWQYSSKGSVPGIKGHVDMNKSF